MPIIYYADGNKKKPYYNPVELKMKSRKVLSDDGHADLTASGLNYTFWQAEESWLVHEVSLHFGSADLKDYSAIRVTGRGIISQLNDLLWLKCDGYPEQDIYLTQGFYTGATLATELQTQLDANAAFVAAGVAPFTVSYDNVTGKFTITTAAGNIQYFQTNTTVGVNRNSTAGIVFGFTTDGVAAGTITNDTDVCGLNNEIPIITQNNSVAQNVIVNMNDLSPQFDVDSGLKLTTSVVATTVNYKILYEKYF